MTDGNFGDWIIPIGPFYCRNKECCLLSFASLKEWKIHVDLHDKGTNFTEIAACRGQNFKEYTIGDACTEERVKEPVESSSIERSLPIPNKPVGRGRGRGRRRSRDDDGMLTETFPCKGRGRGHGDKAVLQLEQPTPGGSREMVTSDSGLIGVPRVVLFEILSYAAGDNDGSGMFAICVNSVARMRMTCRQWNVDVNKLMSWNNRPFIFRLDEHRQLRHLVHYRSQHLPAIAEIRGSLIVTEELPYATNKPILRCGAGLHGLTWNLSSVKIDAEFDQPVKGQLMTILAQSRSCLSAASFGKLIGAGQLETFFSLMVRCPSLRLLSISRFDIDAPIHLAATGQYTNGHFIFVTTTLDQLIARHLHHLFESQANVMTGLYCLSSKDQGDYSVSPLNMFTSRLLRTRDPFFDDRRKFENISYIRLSHWDTTRDPGMLHGIRYFPNVKQVDVDNIFPLDYVCPPIFGHQCTMPNCVYKKFMQCFLSASTLLHGEGPFKILCLKFPKIEQIKLFATHKCSNYVITSYNPAVPVMNHMSNEVLSVHTVFRTNVFKILLYNK